MAIPLVFLEASGVAVGVREPIAGELLKWDGPATLVKAGIQLTLAYEVALTNKAEFAVDNSGDLTITPSGTKVVVAGTMEATVFNGPIGTGVATPAAGSFTTGAFSGAVSLGATPATSGALNLTNAQIIKWRNAGGLADINALYVNASDILLLGADNDLASITVGTASVDTTVVGELAVTDATDATSATAASLKTAGGIACVKDAWVGAQLHVAGTGPNAFGGAAVDWIQNYFRGSRTSGGAGSAAVGTLFGSDITGAAGDTGYMTQLYAAGNLILGDNVTGVVSTLRLDEPSINLNGNTAAKAATLYISGAPTEGTGAEDYAILVDSGAVSLGGTLGVTGNSTHSAEFLMAGVSSPAQITGDADNYATAGFSHLRLDTDGNHDITGFAGGSAGKMLWLTNVGGNSFTLTNEDASSTAANRIITGHAAPLTITSGETVIAMYDGVSSRWRIYGHHA